MVSKITNAPTNNELIAKTNEIIENIPNVSSKANIDLDNITSTGKSVISGLSAPSNTYEDLTLLASGNSYTAPANGYFWLRKTIKSTEYISLEGASGITSRYVRPAATSDCDIWIPAKKNETVYLWYTATGATKYFRFIYAVGSESEAS